MDTELNKEKKQEIVACVLANIINENKYDRTERTIHEIIDEVLFHDSYGKGNLLWVSVIRDIHAKYLKADKEYKHVLLHDTKNPEYQKIASKYFQQERILNKWIKQVVKITLNRLATIYTKVA